jgi:hypothetical protein
MEKISGASATCTTRESNLCCVVLFETRVRFSFHIHKSEMAKTKMKWDKCDFFSLFFMGCLIIHIFFFQ